MASTLVVLSSLTLVTGLSALSNVVADLRAVIVVELPEPPAIEIAEPARPPQVPARPVFRHSVVSGGVYSADDVEAAMEQEGIVAAHYSGMNARELRVETLSEERRVYMSYRIGDEIFWTKRRVHLPKGETILTDGIHHIRARCGNCIAFAPMEPTADDEPDAMEFDALADDNDVVQSRIPLGSEVLLQPFAGMPLPWLLSSPPGDIARSDPTGGIGIPFYGYPVDPTQLQGDPGASALFPVDDGWRSVDGSTPPFGPSTHLPPGDPSDPGDPGDPHDSGDPADPFTSSVPPIENPVVPAPEPATLLLVGGGLATLAARRRRR